MKSIRKFLWLHFQVGYVLSKREDFEWREIRSGWKNPAARAAKIAGWLVQDLSHRIETQLAESRKRIWLEENYPGF